mmetsp:Transcript_29503/g.74128  ORF Transcript_29503/g.74128 Transcript_29503/m.74128 type:complete len:243 (-) Transcript_29503:673-1401(-)
MKLIGEVVISDQRYADKCSRTSDGEINAQRGIPVESGVRNEELIGDEGAYATARGETEEGDLVYGLPAEILTCRGEGELQVCVARALRRVALVIKNIVVAVLGEIGRAATEDEDGLAKLEALVLSIRKDHSLVGPGKGSVKPLRDNRAYHKLVEFVHKLSPDRRIIAKRRVHEALTCEENGAITKQVVEVRAGTEEIGIGKNYLARIENKRFLHEVDVAAVAGQFYRAVDGIRKHVPAAVSD